MYFKICYETYFMYFYYFLLLKSSLEDMSINSRDRGRGRERSGDVRERRSACLLHAAPTWGSDLRPGVCGAALQPAEHAGQGS